MWEWKRSWIKKLKIKTEAIFKGSVCFRLVGSAKKLRRFYISNLNSAFESQASQEKA